MKIPSTSVRFETVLAVSFLLFIPSTFANTVDQAENTVRFSQSNEWNLLIGGLDYIASHPELKKELAESADGDGSATGTKGVEVNNAFITHFKANLIKSVIILYVHGYYTLFQERHLTYTIRNADITGADAPAILELIGKLGAAN